MPTLNWVRPRKDQPGDRVIDSVSVLLSTDVWLRALAWTGQPPAEFFVRRVHSRLVRRVLERAGYPRPGAQATVAPVERVSADVYKADGPWPAGFLGRGSRACLYFDAGGKD